MLTYYCCGCRAQYLAQPKRCPRCKGRAFAGVHDDAPTAHLLNDDGAAAFTLQTENLDDELRAAFEASERFRLAAISGRPVAPEPANVPAPSFAPNAPPGLQDFPFCEAEAPGGDGLCSYREGHESVHSFELGADPGLLPRLRGSPAVVLEGDDAPATPRDMPARGEAYDPALSVNRPEGER